MCGIAGGWSIRRFNDLCESLPGMTSALVHRGPDDAGHWHDAGSGIALGHRRLAIVDLSPQGHQPMVSSNGRFVIAYNGEIYNHLDIRRDIEKLTAPNWRGHSDTETLLAAVELWGLEPALTRCVGMFAFAIWDKQTRELKLARDRLGEKPLYYGWQGSTFAFASELSAIAMAPGFKAEVDRDSVAQFLRYANVPSPWSIYKDIKKLPPGCVITLTMGNVEALSSPEPIAYWNVRQAWSHAKANQFTGSDSEAIRILESHLSRSVNQMSIADVPLGAFLSGGVDSTTIVSLMQASRSRPVKTFTIGFDDTRYNEADHAKAISSFLGTDHTELYVSDADLLNVVPQLGALFSEPFADSSQIPTLLVSRLARQHVTVSLSGDGGDELFHGYGRYNMADRMDRRLNQIPGFFRSALARGMKSMPIAVWDTLLAFDRRRNSRDAVTGDRIHKLADMISARGDDGFYRSLMTHWDNAEDVAIGASLRHHVYGGASPTWPGLAAERYMAKDMEAYLSDDILTKVDRTGMSASLESRIPLLDHRVVEFALSLPMNMKQRDGKSKWILRQVLHNHVPESLFNRPKMGFAIPLAKWLRGPLRDWAAELLDQKTLREQGILNADAVQQKWAEHLQGKRDWQRHLWDVLMLQAWLRHSRGA